MDTNSAPPEMAINVPLLRKALDHITAHPQEWRQELYGMRTDCGTTGCIAYHAVVLAGHSPGFGADGGTNTVSDVLDRRGDPAYLPIVAAADLGLNPDQRWALFCGGNSLADLWRLAAEFTAGEIEVPEHLPITTTAW